MSAKPGNLQSYHGSDLVAAEISDLSFQSNSKQAPMIFLTEVVQVDTFDEQDSTYRHD